MNPTEMKMVGLLEDLKENHHAFGVKGNMESSGMEAWETIRLKEVTLRAGLPLTIKLGGAEALTDMRGRGVERDWWAESERRPKRPEPSPPPES